jgi:type IV secretion system protein TrbB
VKHQPKSSLGTANINILIHFVRETAVIAGDIGTIHASTAIGALRRLEQLVQEAVVTVPRALIAETVNPIAVLTGRGRARRLSDLAMVEGLGSDGDYAVESVVATAEGDTCQ